jgi:hypothetical protein
MRPTPLSVKSATLMTRAHGWAARRGCDVLAVLLVLVDFGGVDRVCDGRDQVGDSRTEARGQHRERARLTCGREVVGVVFDRVVEQSRADDVGIAYLVVADDPECYTKEVVEIRFALAMVQCVEPPRELQRLLGLPPTSLVAESSGFGRESFAQPSFAVQCGDRMQRHHVDDAPLDGITVVDAGRGCPACRVTAVAALPAHLNLVGTDAEVAFEDVRRAARRARLADHPLGRVSHRPSPSSFHQSTG